MFFTLFVATRPHHYRIKALGVGVGGGGAEVNGLSRFSLDTKPLPNQSWAERGGGGIGEEGEEVFL